MSQQKKDMSQRHKRMFDFLSRMGVGVLASVDPNHEPHAAVIYYAINAPGFSIDFITKTGTKKYDNLKRNKHVTLVVFDAKTQTVATVNGSVSEITQPNEIKDIAANIQAVAVSASSSTVLPLDQIDAGEHTAFRITPAQIRLTAYNKRSRTSYSDMFESIESFELDPTGD